jgi:hypothetical protein
MAPLLQLFLLFCLGAAGETGSAQRLQATMLPPFRVSTNVQPTMKLANYGNVTARFTVNVTGSDGLPRNLLTSSVAPGSHASFDLKLQSFLGPLDIDVLVQPAAGSGEESLSIEYEVVNTGATSTRLLDGAWVELIHWSEFEGQMYNPQLRQATNNDWKDQMQYMAQVGVKTAVLQAVFYNNAYTLHNNQTCTDYPGYKLYPSQLFPHHPYPNFTVPGDKLEAMYAAADRYGINIIVGVGLFAWFDYHEQSLCWHKKIAQELHRMYGHHSSFYGFYVTEEMGGDFWKDSAPQFYYPGVVDDMAYFYKNFKSFVDTELDPLLVVMMACNSFHWDKYAADWARIMPHLDIISPFGFSRGPEWDNLSAILSVAQKTGTRVWVDMELFRVPIPDSGLIPKTIGDLIAEIKKYDAVENILGYEFTGLLDSPFSRLHLGSWAAVETFSAYEYYYHQRFDASN